MYINKPPVRPISSLPSPTEQLASPLNAAAGLFGRQRTYTVASHYKLTGVVVDTNKGDSVALISINNKPAQALRVGREIIPGVTVQEVQRGYVLLNEHGVGRRVDLPKDLQRKRY